MTEPVAAQFLPDQLPTNPMLIVEQWLAEARAAGQQPNSNAMTLATADADGQPSARIVLCKDLDATAGHLAFYTNYRSRKADEIADNQRVAVVFHWDRLGRQVRIEGIARRVSAEQSDRYFENRPRASQIGAWASAQSQPLRSRAELEAQFEDRRREFETLQRIPRPPHWGGYRVWAAALELWVEGSGRIHDRARFERDIDLGAEQPARGEWRGQRLQP